MYFYKSQGGPLGSKGGQMPPPVNETLLAHCHMHTYMYCDFLAFRDCGNQSDTATLLVTYHISSYRVLGLYVLQLVIHPGL